MGDRRIIFADTAQVEELDPYVDQVLIALGHPDAWVSDESMIWDFGLTPEEIDAVSERLGVPVSKKDRIIEVAKRLQILPN